MESNRLLDQNVEEIFTRDQVSRFNFSLSDPKLVKFNLVKYNQILDIKLIFKSVHDKHQFAELLDLKAESAEPRDNQDLRMLNVTWNMGGNEKISFTSVREDVFQNAD